MACLGLGVDRISQCKLIILLKRPIDLRRPILCIGDSLTQGMIPDPGYPGALRDLLPVEVINRGVSGLSTTPAIPLLQRSLELNPQLVVIELGGHDFLKGHSRAATKANLHRMIQMCHAADARVVLLEIPRGVHGRSILQR